MVKAKKSLGQNFLNDEKTLKDIVFFGEVGDGDCVLEIGPGTGNLTRELLASGAKVLAIEKDEQLAGMIRNTFSKEIESGKLKVLEGDILKLNVGKELLDFGCQSYKLIANIPYYITGEIIRNFLETDFKPSLFVLLVQKEVAERICAKPGQLSILGVSVQLFGNPEIKKIVPRDFFDPAPEVDSAVIKIDGIKNFDREYLKSFFRLVKVGFAARRKTLANNLASGLKLGKSEAEKMIVALGLDASVRAQQLSLEQWKELLKNFDVENE